MDLELGVANGKAHFFNNSSVLSTGQLALLLGSGSSNDHFSRAEDQPCGFRVSQSHDDGCKSVRIILGSFSFPGDLFQIELAA